MTGPFPFTVLSVRMSWMHRLVRRDDASLTTRTAPADVGPSAPHAVVVGAGMGGLAAAVRLRARGFRVTLVERLDQPGGRARVFEQDGFTFDAGPTVITAPFLFDELWSLCGRERSEDVELVPVDPFYRIRFDDGTGFDYTGDRERMEAEIARFSEPDVEGYRRFLEKSEEIFEIGFEELGHVPFDRLSDMLRIVPAMMKLAQPRVEVHLPPQDSAGAVVPPAARRGESVQHHVHLHADRVSGAEVGRVVRDGRHRVAGVGAVRPPRGPERDPALRGGGLTDSRRRGHGGRRGVGKWRADPGRSGGLQRGRGLDLSAPD
jgi:hypothetical protein